jgi:hypothetical protein
MYEPQDEDETALVKMETEPLLISARSLPAGVLDEKLIGQLEFLNEHCQAVEVTKDNLDALGDLLGKIKRLEDWGFEAFHTAVSHAHKLMTHAGELRNRYTIPLACAQTALKSKLEAFVRQERQRAELARQLAEEAERKARRDEAARLAALGKEKEAVAVVSAPMPAPKPEPPPKKIKGVSSRQVWRAKIVDVDRVPREYMIPNQKMLDEKVNACKGAIQIPGVEVYEDAVTSVRGR